jgi:hypothetical protein
MSATKRVCRLAKITSISMITITVVGMSSCTFQSEDDFAAQNGFKRSDYFGNGGNRNFVPAAVKNPDYYISDREIPMGRPGY